MSDAPALSEAPALPLIGVSDWITITQDDTRAFGVLTRSSERLHDDPDWAAAHSPFGTTIAHGFQLLSLLTAFLADVRPWASQDPVPGQTGRVGVNYGFDRVRFIAPVPVGSRVRCVFRDGGSEEVGPGRLRTCMICTIEIEGQDRPAVTAEWLGLDITLPAPAQAQAEAPATRA